MADAGPGHDPGGDGGRRATGDLPRARGGRRVGAVGAARRRALGGRRCLIDTAHCAQKVALPFSARQGSIPKMVVVLPGSLKVAGGVNVHPRLAAHVCSGARLQLQAGRRPEHLHHICTLTTAQGFWSQFAARRCARPRVPECSFSSLPQNAMTATAHCRDRTVLTLMSAVHEGGGWLWITIR